MKHITIASRCPLEICFTGKGLFKGTTRMEAPSNGLLLAGGNSVASNNSLTIYHLSSL